MADPLPPKSELEKDPTLPELDDATVEHEDAIARVLLRVMDTDPESNVVFGNIPPGEAEDYAAAVTYAEFSASPVILRYENMKNMAKRAEKGSLLDKILTTIRAIGKTPGDPKLGFFGRFRKPM